MNDRIWTKNFVLAWIVNFLSMFVLYLLLVTIAGYAVETYHASTGIAGFVASIYLIGGLAGRLGAGRLVAQAGPYKILVWGAICFFISACFYFIQIHIFFLLFARFLQGLFMGMIGTAAGTVAASILPSSRKGEGMGFYTLSVILASALGPFVGIFLMKLDEGYVYILGLNIALAFLMVLVLPFMKLDGKIFQPSLNKQQNEEGILAKFIEPKSVPISLVALLIGIAIASLTSYISFFAIEIDLVEAASFFFLVYAITIFFTRPLTGRIMDRKGPNVIIYPCLIIFALGMFVFSQANSGFVLLLSALLIGFGFGNFGSIAQTIAIKVTEPHRYSYATSTYFILYDFGCGFGPYAVGLLIPFLGYRATFLSLVFIILLCIPLYALLVGRKENIKLFPEQKHGF